MKTVVVETMGYADAIYRQRKVRTQTRMSVLFGGAPVIHHDFHQPPGLSQQIRDRRFWLDCREAITRKHGFSVDRSQSRQAAEWPKGAADRSKNECQEYKNLRP
jgi:hypothetical protein